MSESIRMETAVQPEAVDLPAAEPAADAANERAADADAAALPSGPRPAPEPGISPDPGPAEVFAPPEPSLPAASASQEPDALDRLSDRYAELSGLLTRQVELVDKLHAENQRLRLGELAQALQPMIRGLLKLHDLMTKLKALDSDGTVAQLRTQLDQIFEDVGIRRYEPTIGEAFDSERHQGMHSLPTDDPTADRTVAKVTRAGFVRDDGSIVRVADVEVHRLVRT